MTLRLLSRAALALSCWVLTACAGRTRDRSVDQTVGTIRSRTGLAVDTNSDLFARQPLPEVRKALKSPLNADSAVRLAVLNNKHVRAELEGLGIAVSELIAATRPPNPRVEGHAAFSRGSLKNGNYGGSVEIGLTQLLTMRGRRQVAKHELAAEQLRVADDVMTFALEVRSTFHGYTAARRLVAIGVAVQESAQASADAAQALLDAGNIPQLEYEMERAFLEESRLSLALTQKAELDLREELNSLFGVWGPYTRWVPAEDFPPMPSSEPTDGEVERIAIEHSLELAQMREHIEAAAGRIGIAKVVGIVPDLNAGLDLDFEEGFKRIGPIVSGQLPLFDQGQGGIMRAMAELDQERARYVATAIELRSEARRTRNALTIARQVVLQYQNTIIPLRQRVTDERLRQYNAMNSGIFELIATKRQEFEATQSYVRALRDYWIARAELVQVQAGGALLHSAQAYVSTSNDSVSSQQGGH